MTRNSEASLYQALAHPSRRAVLAYLRDKDFARAGDIAEALGIGRSTLSSHLRMLSEAGLLVSRRSGTEIHYRTNFTVLEDLLVRLADLRAPTPDDPSEATDSDPQRS